jgi:hypothetical protein
MKGVILMEESQEICKAFRAKGHEFYSCDIKKAGGGHPEWHIQRDAREVIKEYWDIGICHPVCTDLTVSGA